MDIKKDKAMILNIIFMIVLVITLVFRLFYKEEGEIFRIGLAAVTTWLLYFVYKKTFLKRSATIYYFIFAFMFAAMYLGSIFSFYSLVPMWDKILHLLSGVIIAYIGHMLFFSLIKADTEDGVHPMACIIFSVIFAVAAAGIWEIWEFSTDQLLGFMSQNNSLWDTMWDIICGTVTGIVANIPVYLYVKGKKVKFVEKMLKEFKS